MSELFIRTDYIDGKTVITDCSFTSPFKIAKPFYRDKYTEIMIMCASPGILAGDKYEINFEMSNNTKTVITEQSYRKLYDTGKDLSEQNTVIQISDNSALYYAPYPVIPFAGSRFHSRTDINLRASSKLIYGEILSCGRYGSGERFKFAEYLSRTSVTVEGKPVFLDNCRMKSDEADFSGTGFFEGYTSQGVFYIYGFDDISLPEDAEIQCAVSKAAAGYTIRALSNSANHLHQYMQELFLGMFLK